MTTLTCRCDTCGTEGLAIDFTSYRLLAEDERALDYCKRCWYLLKITMLEKAIKSSEEYIDRIQKTTELDILKCRTTQLIPAQTELEEYRQRLALINNTESLPVKENNG